MDEEELDTELDNPTLETEEENGGGQGGVVDPEKSQALGEDEDEGTGEGAENDGSADQNHVEQSHQDNAAARAARIRAEQETAQRMQAQYDRDVAGAGIPNPLTGKPFASFKEFQDYGKELRLVKLEEEAKRRGQPVETILEEQENRAYISRKRAEDEQREMAEEDARQKSAFLKNDLLEFVAAYPQVDVVKLESNPKFKKFAGGRLYKESLSGLYSDFCEVVDGTAEAAVLRANGKQERSTGGGQGGGGVTLTPRQTAELAEWNRENPDLKMTAKEFMGQ